MPQPNICPCPNPPGGSITCRPDQLAFCAIENGAIRSGCVDMPREITMGLQRVYDYNVLPSSEFLCWVFGAMTERSLDVATLELELQTHGVDGLRDKKILELLKNGQVTLFGRTAHFRLPKKVNQRVRAAVAV
jgi:hypothetical protein